MSVGKIFFSLSMLGNFLFLGYFLYNRQSIKLTNNSFVCSLGSHCSDNFAKKKQSTEKIHRVAILTPASHAALVEVEKGFQNTLRDIYAINCDFTIYNANGNRTLMRSQIEEIIQKKYDLIFTIGAHATQMAKEITTKKQHFTPLVFGAIADPVRLKIIDSELASGTHVTGDATATNYPDQIALMLKLKPTIKKVLIVYDPTQSSGLERDKIEVEKLFAARGITTKAIEVYKTSEIMQKASSFVPEVDLVMIFKDNTVIPGINALLKLCNRYGVTFFASDLDSVGKGAALGFGVREYEFGVAAAEHAYKILHDNQNPAHMPITRTKNYRLRLNEKVMREQGLSIDPEQLFFMKSIEVV